MPRWMEYQKALSRGIHPVYPFTEKVIDDGLCEWANLGQDGREVYAWAMCEIKSYVSIRGGSVPVVIQLSETGEITDVLKLEDGNSYRPSIEKLFPLGCAEDQL